MAPTDAQIDKFHLSLNVENLERSVAFYRTLFNLAPAKSFKDYAKFELVDPPVIMSLVPRAPAAGTQSCGFGIRMPNRANVLEERSRLEAAGIKTQTQECTRCTYTEQLRVHVGDPDGNYWSFYSIDRHVDPADIRQSEDGELLQLLAAPARSIAAWEHFATHPLPDAIPHADRSLDEVRLTGSMNQIENAGQRAELIREAYRVLKPGGKLHISGLMADRPFPNGEPALKNIVIPIKTICVIDEVHGLLVESGFVGIEMQNSKVSTERFTYDGVHLGEAHFRAVKLADVPAEDVPESDCVVFYQGPFARTHDDLGNEYVRGRRVKVDATAWGLLRGGASANQFVFLDPRSQTSDEGSCSV